MKKILLLTFLCVLVTQDLFAAKHGFYMDRRFIAYPTGAGTIYAKGVHSYPDGHDCTLKDAEINVNGDNNYDYTWYNETTVPGSKAKGDTGYEWDDLLGNTRSKSPRKVKGFNEINEYEETNVPRIKWTCTATANDKWIFAVWTKDSIQYEYNGQSGPAKLTRDPLTYDNNGSNTTISDNFQNVYVSDGIRYIDEDVYTYPRASIHYEATATYTSLVVYIANFTRIAVKTTDSSQGTVSIDKFVNGVTDGEEVTITATPAEDVSFLGWTKEGSDEIVSTENPYTLKANEENAGYYIPKFGEVTTVTINEAEDYTPTDQQANVELKRSFSANAYNTLVLPFDLDAAAIDNTFGEGNATIYAYSNASESTIDFTTSTDGIKANVPVLIWLNEAASDLNFDLVNIQSTTTPKAEGSYYDFVGTYNVTYAPKNSYIFSGTKYFSVDKENSVRVKGTRAYIKAKTSEAKGLAVHVDGEDMTDKVSGILGLDADEEKEDVYYTIQGVKVTHPTKGIYIHNNKKVIIK